MAPPPAIVRGVASVMGLGHLPLAPGTWASAAAAAAYWLARSRLGPAGLGLIALGFVVAVVACVLVCPAAERAYGNRDPRQLVIDEVAGCWLTCLLFWWRGPAETAVAAFVAFRVFDVTKVFPIRRLEKLPGGWGVVLDDLGAALYAAAALWPLCYGVLEEVFPTG
jgi:phosphatidylglycerophosphatase A